MRSVEGARGSGSASRRAFESSPAGSKDCQYRDPEQDLREREQADLDRI